MKRSFFQAAVASVLLYGCTTWTLTKRLEKKLDANYTRMLRANHGGNTPQSTNYTTTCLPSRKLSSAGHCWMNRDEFISDILQWTPTYGRAKAGRPARTYIQQVCEDTGCSPEDMPEALNDR